MFSYQETKCPHRRRKTDTTTFVQRDETTTSSARLTLYGNRVTAAERKNEQLCLAEAYHKRPYGNRVNAQFEIVYAENFSWRAFALLDMHIDYVSAGHGFWHFLTNDCHKVGFSEVTYAEFCNWLLLIFGQFLNNNTKFIESIGQQHETNMRIMMYNAISYAANGLWDCLDVKQKKCNGDFPTHRVLDSDKFNEYIKEALVVRNMIFDHVDPNVVNNYVIEQTRPYLFHYTYHMQFNPDCKNAKTLYSHIMQHKVYGRKIRL